jgi:sulfide:quinone oxidoreductase
MVLEPFGLGHAPRFELTEVLAHTQAKVVIDRVTRLNTARKMIFMASGDSVTYDAVVITTGARADHGDFGEAIVMDDRDSTQRIAHVIAELEAGLDRSVVFAAPAGKSWTLPVYELALMTASRMRRRLRGNARVMVVTSEQAPLQVFGDAVRRHIAKQLEVEGIELYTNTVVSGFSDGIVHTNRHRPIMADRVVILPRLYGHPIEGLPHNEDGFLPTDEYGLVDGTEDVYAAGDITTFPVKQGGIGAQQADVVSERLAMQFGERESSRPFKPELRAVLLSEDGGTMMRSAFEGDEHDAEVGAMRLRSATDKISSYRLSPRLTRLNLIHGRGG